MGLPEPVTPRERDFGRRVQTAYDLEVTLVGFLRNLFVEQRLDNPTLNLAQSAEPVVTPMIVRDPDELPVSFDYTQRAQTLALKVPPRVERGRIPRTVTGEIALDKLADVPNIIVQAIRAKVEITSTIATVRIFFSAYDENPDSQGYQDVLNMIETAALALTSFGQQAIDRAYPIVMPIEWQMVEAESFPHFIGEMTTTWELPSARPMPDLETFGIIPVEHIDLRASHSGDFSPLFADDDEEPQPPEPELPPIPQDDIFMGTFRPADVNAAQDLINFDGMTSGLQIRFAKSQPNNSLPDPITEGRFYYSVNATASAFQIASTWEGAVIPLNDSGTGNNNEIWRKG
jgi:hypothetical protein